MALMFGLALDRLWAMYTGILQETHRRRPHRIVAETLAVALVLLALVVLFSEPLAAQKAGKAMQKNEVIGLLESGVDSAKVAQAAREYGIAFELTAEAEKQLRDAGATDDLLKVLRDLAPKPKPVGPGSASHPASPRTPAPAVLLVEVTPGSAQVYVDDEPVGTTSQAGRLKLSQLSPGEHRVRVSLANHHDFEQSVELAAGETAHVSATLEATRAPEPVIPSTAGEPQPQISTPGDPATLGILLAAQSPAGIRGAHINDVTPGGPAQKAGLRPGLTIVSVNGQPVNSPQDLLQMIPRFQPGQVIQIGFTDGRSLQMTRAQLVARSSLSAQIQSSPSAAANPPSAMPQATPGATFGVGHDHGAAGADYCLGVMTIGAGVVRFRSTNGVHGFDFAASDIKEAKKNSVYLSAIGAFHIRLKQGTNYNFVLLNAAGQYQAPDPLLQAIAQAMGKN